MTEPRGGPRPVALCVLDGLGLSYRKRANAFALARTPALDELMAGCPMTTLDASGEAVGLAVGQMGDSNVGHLNLGAGRIVYQELVRIDKAIETGVLFDSAPLVEALRLAARPGATLHLVGLVSDGGVHSHIRHIFALIDAAARAGVGRLAMHALLDGRDVPPTSALRYVEALEVHLGRAGVGVIATVAGRYYGMDRDRRWERTQLAYRAIVHGEGDRAESAAAAVQAGYARGETDEFLRPTVIVPHGADPTRAKDGDVVILANFRADRMRQIVAALASGASFEGFDRGPHPALHVLGMAQYDEALGLPSIVLPQRIDRPLGEVFAAAGIPQFRLAETEKYAHVTFFFNGGADVVYPGEDRRLVPSPKVATYDLKPEMSAAEVTEAAVKAFGSGRYGLIVMNYANPDMVGHTGVLPAAIAAVEAVDRGLARVVEAAKASGTTLLVVADHGNCEQMIDYETGKPHTNHTLNPVPLILVDPLGPRYRLRSGGVLANVAPTLLELAGLARPPEMNRDSLLEPIGPSQ